MEQKDNLMNKKEKIECVVLVHGILKDAGSMQYIENELKQRDYAVINTSYNYKDSIFEIADSLFIRIDEILKKNNYEYKKLHFIGHSLGGLVIRAILSKYMIKNLGNVVQIATPNHGSEIADFLKNMFFYKRYCGKAGQELITKNHILKEQLGEINYSLGVIIGTKSNMLSDCYIKERNDGRVSVTSAKINGMQDYTEVYDTHNKLLKNPKVIYEIMHFIKHGDFITSRNISKNKFLTQEEKGGLISDYED